jgi:inner membrane protein
MCTTVVTHQLSGLVFALGIINFSLFYGIRFYNGSFGISFFLYLFFSILGSVFPDIDEPNSYIGRKFSFLSHIFKGILGHRGFTHSFLGMFLFTFIIAGIIYGYYGQSFYYSLFFCLGYFSNILGDLMTKRGVPILSPFF